MMVAAIEDTIFKFKFVFIRSCHTESPSTMKAILSGIYMPGIVAEIYNPNIPDMNAG